MSLSPPRGTRQGDGGDAARRREQDEKMLQRQVLAAELAAKTADNKGMRHPKTIKREHDKSGEARLTVPQ